MLSVNLLIASKKNELTKKFFSQHFEETSEKNLIPESGILTKRKSSKRNVNLILYNFSYLHLHLNSNAVINI